ncbi:MAG: DUF1700 domain-containing protein [Eubacteriales bacterium]|nr:DUF1700 domain-containing protein [Eubacteriales bacterium]
MRKEAFLKELEKRLSVLDEKEREDMLSEYAQHIDWKMQGGMSEEEAIDDFGEIGSLAEELLEAYHIDPAYAEKEKKNRMEHIGKTAGTMLSQSKKSASGVKRWFASLRRRIRRKWEVQKEKRRRRKEERMGKGGWLSMAVYYMEELFYFCLKAWLLVFVLLPLGLLGIGSIVAFGLLLVLLVQGYPLIGATLAVCGLCLCLTSAIAFLMTFFVAAEE